MKRILLQTILFSLLIFQSLRVHAQDKKVEMADVMRSNGRIYVVITVMLIILAGLILYLVRLDRKLKKMEREN